MKLQFGILCISSVLVFTSCGKKDENKPAPTASAAKSASEEAQTPAELRDWEGKLAAENLVFVVKVGSEKVSVGWQEDNLTKLEKNLKK